MRSTFEQRLRAAVRAGWWTLLVGIIVVTLQWGFFLAFTARRPEWAPALWGSNMTWAVLERRWFGALVTMRLVLFVLAMGVVWATIWSAVLRRRVAASGTERVISEPAMSPM